MILPPKTSLPAPVDSSWQKSPISGRIASKGKELVALQQNARQFVVEYSGAFQNDAF